MSFHSGRTLRHLLSPIQAAPEFVKKLSFEKELSFAFAKQMAAPNFSQALAV